METKIQIKSNLDTLSEFATQLPVDVKSAAEAIGVRVIIDELPEGVSGKIQRDNEGGYYIVANQNEPPVRQRFTIAHELGHYVYHRSLIGDGVSDSPAYRAPDDSVYDKTPLEPIHERQANQFAANMLMPMAKIREIENQNPNIDVRELAKRFHVSEDAMRIRKGMKTRRQELLEQFEAN